MRVSFVSFDYTEYCVRTASAIAELEDVQLQLLMPGKRAEGFANYIAPSIETAFFQRARFRQPLQQARMLRSIWQSISDFSPDVVHFQGAHLWFNFLLRRIARRFPLVVTAHNPRHHVGDRSSRKTPQWVMDMGFKAASRLVVHGDLLKQQLCDYLNVEPTRVSVIPHIAMGGREATGHVDAAAPGVARARRDTDVRILFFGRIWEYKGLEYLIKAQPLVTAQHPDARFVIGGEGEDFERYRKMMTNPETFELHIERVSDEKRERLFADATIVVLPYISATQSGVIPIAFNHSVPVIATDVGALREVIHHERTGLLIPPRDTEALGKAINRLLDHPQLRAELGSNGNLFLQEQCSDQAVGSAHLAAYKQAAQAFSEAQHR